MNTGTVLLATQESEKMVQTRIQLITTRPTLRFDPETIFHRDKITLSPQDVCFNKQRLSP